MVTNVAVMTADADSLNLNFLFRPMITLFQFAVVGLLLGLALLLLFRNHINRQLDRIVEAAKDRSFHRTHGIDARTGDLEGLKQSLVDFFASSKVSSTILGILAARLGPLSFKSLLTEVQTEKGRRGIHHDIPVSSIRAVLGILQFARLARLSRAGFSITTLGREVYTRMRTDAHRADRSHSVSTLAPLTERIPCLLKAT